MTWECSDGVDDTSDYGGKGQVFDAGGAPVGAEFLVNTRTFFFQLSPFVATLPSGGVVVTRASNDGVDDTSEAGIKARFFTEPPFAPTLDLNGAAGPNARQGDDVTLAYTEDDGAVAVAPDLTLTDPDGGPISQLSVTLTTPQAGDALALSGTFGDALHAVLCGCGHNIRLILAHLRALVAEILRVILNAIAALIPTERPSETPRPLPA